MKQRKLRIAFVVPRYAVGSAGGAEVLAKGLAERLRDVGYGIEVFTTCARDHIRWENYFEPGVEEINGIAVRRFKVNENRDFEKYLEIQERIIKYEELSLDEEKGWISESVNSEELYRHIDRERVNFDCFVFIPYMFGTTYWGAQIVSEKSVLIPCLHDEPYAEMEIFQELFDNVKGVIFNTVPEMKLGKRIYGFPESKAAVVGMGFDDRGGYRPEDFRKKFRIREPFILYAGRREGGKNTDLLVEYFRLYKRHNRNDLKLVFIGTGEVKLNPIDRKYIVDLGFISDEDKDNA